MRSRVIALATGILAVSLGFAGAEAAHADLADCAGTTLYSPEGSGGYYEYTTPDLSSLPEPLRSLGFDCAVVIATDSADSKARNFTLYSSGTTWAETLAIMQGFEDAGWDLTSSQVYLDRGAGEEFVDFASVADAAAIDSPPMYSHRALSTGPSSSVVAWRYVDGITYFNDNQASGPQLELKISLTDAVVAPVAPVVSNTGIGDPSVLSDLKTVKEAVPSASESGVLVVTAALLTLLVGYPGFLLSRVVASRYDQLFGWTRRGPFKRLTERMKAAQPGWLIWPGLAVASVAAAFIDPRFGLNLLSLRVVLTLLIAFAVYNVLGWTVVRKLVARFVPDAKPVIKFRWGSLAIVIAAVLFSRIFGFNPGLVFGLVAGLVFAVGLALSKEVIVILIGSAFAVAAALVAWVGYSLVAPIAEPGNVLAVSATEVFSAITIEGVATLPIALLPFATLDGGVLARWNRWVWAGCYGVGVALFLLVMVTVPGNFAAIRGDFVRWVVIFVVLAAIAVGVWALDLVLTRRKAAASAAGPPAT